MRKWLLLLLLGPVLGLSLQACNKKLQDQPDCGFQKNVYGERVSWQDDVPISLYVHESFPADKLPALYNAIKTWEDVVGHQLFKVVQTNVSGPATPTKDGVNMIYWMNTWETDPDKAREQARTTVYFVGNEIREADMRINAYNYTYYLDTPTAYKDLHLESLLLHELGHVLGLAHRADPGTVMATTLASSTVRNKVSSQDKESLLCEY